MSKNLTILVLVATLVFLAIPKETAGDSTPDTLPTLEQILERYIQAVGGCEAFEELVTRVTRARVVTDLPTWDPPVYEVDTLIVYVKTPNKYVVIQRTPRGTIVEGFDGETAWKQDIQGKTFDLGLWNKRSKWLVDLHYPLLLMDYFPDMTFRCKGVLEGRPVYVVDTDDDRAHALYFDVETGLLLRLGFHHEIYDYREIDGVKIPFRIVYSRKGGSSTFILNSVEHNIPINDSLFVMPDSSESPTE